MRKLTQLERQEKREINKEQINDSGVSYTGSSCNGW